MPPTPLDVWTAALGPLLNVDELRAVLGSAAALAESERAGALIALPTREGELLYPEFQFSDGSPLPALAEAHRLLSAESSAWTAASWAVNPHPALQHSSPRDWAASEERPDRLLLVARRDAARWAH